MDAVADEFARVKIDPDRKILREVTLDLGEPFFDTFSHGDRVGSALFPDAQADAPDAVGSGDAADIVQPVLDVGHVLQPDDAAPSATLDANSAGGSATRSP